jgi:hypothetical protein
MTTYIQLRFSIQYQLATIQRFVDVLTAAAVRVVTTRTSSLWSREVLFTGGGGQGDVVKERTRQWSLLGTGSWGVCT